ncbi:MAG: DUF3325 domain-containing protein [Spongiibacteraceae bacterium]|nr:DUF3325 domain-containing protein [Spongiibacteraceae bacterium]
MFFNFTLVLIGFIALSQTMRRHFLQVHSPQQGLSWRQILVFRILGVSCLLLAAVFCLFSQGVAVGLVCWVGLVMLGALLHSLQLTYWPRGVMTVGLIALMLGVAVAMTGYFFK